MKKIAFAVLGFFALCIGAILALAAFKPDTTTVTRSRVLRADQATIKPHLTDMKKWVAWSPWAERDPNVQWTFSDQTEGKGAWYEWAGNDDVGKGRMDVTEVTDTEVRYALAFKEPFESSATVVLAMAAADEGTKVSWTMDSENNFASKVFMVFADFDAMIGADFELGLGNLAKRVEG
ncbi:MAG: SRPBCC family protein [Myxococcota bacterium]